jgi:uncharacterized protein YbjT (DUF2867 family)
MKIAVTTPTGHVGARVVQLLLQAGLRPTLLLRNPAKLDPAVRDRVNTVQVDQGDADEVARATEDVDALFWVDPPTSDGDPVAGYTRMGANAARAVEQNQIARTVFLSSVGAEKRFGAGEIDGLARTEQQLDATGSSVLHLRCGFFFTNLLLELPALRQGVLRTTWPLDFTMPWVDPRDIGEVAAARLLCPGWSGRHVQAVHGPQDLSFAQVARILGQVLGRPIRVETITDDELREALRSAGLGQLHVEAIVEMSAGLRENFTAEDKRSILTTTPTTLATWAYTHLLPAVANPGDISR